MLNKYYCPNISLLRLNVCITGRLKITEEILIRRSCANNLIKAIKYSRVDYSECMEWIVPRY